MVYTKKKMFVVAATVLCSVMANLSFADATADSIMFRRKPAAAASPKQTVQETVVQPVAVETVEAPKPEKESTESVKVADVSVEKAVAEKPVSDDEGGTEYKASNGAIRPHPNDNGDEEEIYPGMSSPGDDSDEDDSKRTVSKVSKVTSPGE